MLSLLPQLLFLSPFSATIIRLAVAVAFGYAAWKHSSARNMEPRVALVFEGLCAGLLLAGVYTQAAAILGIVLFFVHAAQPKLRTLPLSTELLLLVMCVSLVVTGAGALAFDLPL